MDNKEADFDSLSQMLSKNKAERLNEKSDKTEDDSTVNKGYNPSADIAMSNDDGKEEATKMIGNVNSEQPMKPPVKNEVKPQQPDKPKKASKRVKHKKTQAEIKSEKLKNSGITALMISLSVLLTIAIVFVSVKIGMFTLDSALDYVGLSTTEFKVTVEIPENPTIDQVADILYDNGLITSTKLFEIYSGMKEADKDYVGGEFELSSVMSFGQLIDTLQASKHERHTVEVRIIEGMTAREIGELLEENCICKADDFIQYYLRKMNLYSFEKRLAIDSHKFYQLEGYLYPDTYEFYACNELLENKNADVDTTNEAEAVAKKIFSNFSTKITKKMYKKMNEMGLTLNELITLASMVQKEAGTIEDMGYIASVFINRLNNPDTFSKLESDVTILYVENEIKPYYDKISPTATVTMLANSYNTYACDGIPAGPICNPGMDAIEAVLYHQDTNYFYFCANEETGETLYATTLEEHEQNLVTAGITE